MITGIPLVKNLILATSKNKSSLENKLWQPPKWLVNHEADVTAHGLKLIF